MPVFAEYEASETAPVDITEMSRVLIEIDPFGIYPYPIDQDDLSRMHGNDERVSVQSLAEGTEMIYRVLLKVAGAD